MTLREFMAEFDSCEVCSGQKRQTIAEWRKCPWQDASWKASTNYPLLPRWFVHWMYFRNKPKHLIKIYY